jgi:hypothetical protein
MADIPAVHLCSVATYTICVGTCKRVDVEEDPHVLHAVGFIPDNSVIKY